MRIFRNKVVQIELKDKKDVVDAPQPEVTTDATKEIIEIAADAAMKTIGAVGAVIAANRILNTVCEIAVIAAKSKFK